MGNMFSGSSNTVTVNKQQLINLEARLRSLEDLDQNRDGVISKEEFEAWKERQSVDLEKFRLHCIKEAEKDFEAKITELTMQVNSLQQMNQTLEQQLAQAQDLNSESESNNLEAPKAKPFSNLSKKKINEMVDRLINNEAVNIKYLPDFAERQLYKNMFNILLGLMNEVVEGSSIELFGHEITMQMTAKEETQTADSPLVDL